MTSTPLPTPSTGQTNLKLSRPDDWHLHLRDGPEMAAVLAHTARVFGRAIVMPNLKPPVTTVAAARAYRDRIIAALPPASAFEPLMTLYLTDNTPPAAIAEAKASGFVHAVKYYPAGATTNSDSGVTSLDRVASVFAAMEKHGVVLSLHGEVTAPEVDMFDRERVFVDTLLDRIVRDFPATQGRARAHHHARGGGRSSRASAQCRGDDHAATPAVLPQRPLRRQLPAARTTTACRS